MAAAGPSSAPSPAPTPAPSPAPAPAPAAAKADALGTLAAPPKASGSASDDKSRGGGPSDGAARHHADDVYDFDLIDPSLDHGHKQVYDEEVPFELRSLEGGATDVTQEIGSLAAVRVRILVNGDEKSLINMRVELYSESDLFFHYVHALDESNYGKVQDWQRLTCDFKNYPRVLMRMLDYCIKLPHSHLAVLVMQRDGSARLDFIQNMEYKFVEMLSCDFVASPEELVREHVNYRYGALKRAHAAQLARLAELDGVITKGGRGGNLSGQPYGARGPRAGAESYRGYGPQSPARQQGYGSAGHGGGFAGAYGGGPDYGIDPRAGRPGVRTGAPLYGAPYAAGRPYGGPMLH